MQRIFGLDVLRVCALFMILLANSLYILQFENVEISEFARAIGFLGLEIFFVLSGFLLTLKLYPAFINSNFDFFAAIKFIKKRLIVIVPLYYFILLINVALAYLINYNVDGIWKYFFFIQNFSDSIPPFFPESWGIPVIVFSAIFFPLLLAAFSQVDKIHKPKIFLCITICIISVFLWTKFLYDQKTVNSDIIQWDISLKTVAIYRFDSLFIGVLAGWIYNNYTQFRNKFRWVFAIVGVFGIVFLFPGVDNFDMTIETHQTFWNVFYLPLMSIFISAFPPIDHHSEFSWCYFDAHIFIFK